MESLESKVEQLCALINKTDNENWDAKNKAVIQMTEMFLEHEGNADAFTANLFRALKEPVKALVCDLRSQQVRDICTLLTALAQVSGERMKLFLRDSFPHILEGIKVPNKVMSGYVDECIFQMIRLTTFKSGIPILAQEIKENKSKLVREKCLDYINEILINWELTDRELDPIAESIRNGIEDASVKARETARITYGNLFLLFPNRAERIRGQLPKGIQTKLLNVEKLLREGRTNDESIHAEVENSLSDSQGAISVASNTSSQSQSHSQSHSSISHHHPPATPAQTPSHHAHAPSSAVSRAMEPRTEARSGPTTRASAMSKPVPTPAPHTRTGLKRGASASSAVTSAAAAAAAASLACASADPYYTPAPGSSLATRSMDSAIPSSSAKSRGLAQQTQAQAQAQASHADNGGVGITLSSANSSSNSLTGAMLKESNVVNDGEKLVLPPTAAAALKGSSRRRSVVKNPFAELSDTFANGVAVSAQQQQHSPGKHTISSLLKASPVRRSPNKAPTQSPSTSAKVQTSKPFVSSVSASASAANARGGTSGTSSSSSSSRAMPPPPPQSPRATNGSSAVTGGGVGVGPSPSTPLHIVAAVQDQVIETTSHHSVDDNDDNRGKEEEIMETSPGNDDVDDATDENSIQSSTESSTYQQQYHHMNHHDAEEMMIGMDASQQAVLRVGSKVLVTWGKEPTINREVGQVRFIGTTLFATGIWIGVELEMPMGKNNGTVQGHFYFSCPPNYGLFVREDNVQIILSGNNNSNTSNANTDTASAGGNGTEDHGVSRVGTHDSSHSNSSSGSSNGGTVSELSTTTESTTSQSSQMTQHDTLMSTNATQQDDQTLNLSISRSLGRSSSQSNNSVTTGTKKKSASSLKIKLSQMMNLLNQQLELVEELEQEERKVMMMNGASNGGELTQGQGQAIPQGSLEKIHELREEVYMITAQELDIVEGFRKRWKDICNL